MSSKETLLSETIASLERAQGFDANDLVQTNRLGEASFDGAVEPAQKVIALFKQLPRSVLDYLPETELNLVKTQANSIYQMFQEILSFDVNEGDVRNRQLAALSRLESAYQTYFSKLYPLISYSMARTVDFNQLEEQGRAAVQSIADQTHK